MSDMLSAWAGVLVVFAAALLVTLMAMVWIIFFRKTARRRRRRHHHHTESYQLNPTLAEIGGLPPVREDKKQKHVESQTPTLISRS